MPPVGSLNCPSRASAAPRGGMFVCPFSRGCSEGIERPVSPSDSTIIPVCFSSFGHIYLNPLVTTP